MANRYTPRRSSSTSPQRRPSSTGEPSRRTAAGSQQYRRDPYGEPARQPRTTSRSSASGERRTAPREGYGQDVYYRRPANRRRRKSGPPLLPILLLILLVAAAVGIFFAARGCASKPQEDPSSGSSSQSSQEAGSGSSGTESGESAAATPSPTPSPTPEPPPELEEPQAAPETLGGIMVVDGAGYEYYNFKEEYANQYITAVADAGEKLAGTATVYDMVIPTSIDITLPESYLEKYTVNTSDQRQAIEEYIYPSINAMNPSVKTVSLFDALKNHADEYIYFRTDHHWTQLGAYYAYVEFCKVRGFEPVALDQFDRKDYTGYLGSFYDSTQNSGMASNPDTVEAYIPRANVTLNATQDDGTVLEDWPLIADGDSYGQSMKYIIYAAGDQPYEEITNNDMASGPSCIVVKESFGNCFLPYLVNHYKTVYVIDYRHYKAGTVTQLAQEKGVDDVLLVNNVSMTRNADLVEQFSAIF